MTRSELGLIAGFLNELGDRYSNDGCEAVMLPDTPENRALVAAADKHAFGEDEVQEPDLYGSKIEASGGRLLTYLEDKFKTEHGLCDLEIPKTG